MDIVKVSVIVPVYNCEKTLEKCVMSIINQTLKDIEIILVDDGATDSSGDLCDKYAGIDTRVKVIHQKNRGVAEARNAGLDISKGMYIGFVDSDDWIESGMFEIMCNIAELNNLDIVRCNTIVHDNNGETISWCPDNIEEVFDDKKIKSEIIPMLIAPVHEADHSKRLLKGCWCCVFKKCLITKNDIRFYSIRSGEDALFIMELMWRAKRLMLLPDAFYHYVREKSDSLSISMNRFRNYKERNYTRNVIKALVKDTMYYPIYEERWEQEDRRYVFLDARIATIYNKGATKSQKLDMLKELLNSDEAVSAFSKPIRSRLPFQLFMLYYIIRHKMYKALYYAMEWKFKSK